MNRTPSNSATIGFRIDHKSAYLFSEKLAKVLVDRTNSQIYQQDVVRDIIFDMLSRQLNLASAGALLIPQPVTLSENLEDITKPIRELYILANLARLSIKARSLGDIGCGRCRYKFAAERLGLNYTGYDTSNSKDLVSDSQKSNFIESDITESSFCPLPADIYLCTEVIEHVPEPIELLRRIYNSMKKGSYFVLTMPYYCTMHQEPYYFYNGFHENFVKHLESKYKFFVEERTLIEFSKEYIFQGYCFKKM